LGHPRQAPAKRLRLELSQNLTAGAAAYDKAGPLEDGEVPRGTLACRPETLQQFAGALGRFLHEPFEHGPPRRISESEKDFVHQVS